MRAPLPAVAVMDLGDLRFRDGKASAEANNCTMLPGGARPAYAEFLTEEPAGNPVTEDALVLVECGSDGMDQALVPVKLGAEARRARPSASSGPIRPPGRASG